MTAGREPARLSLSHRQNFLIVARATSETAGTGGSTLKEVAIGPMPLQAESRGLSAFPAGA
jgi:hypothetical protein